MSHADRLVAVRSKDREFHGLQREFLYAQAQMLVDYAKSKDIKHPRDVGNAREAILGRFLESSGYLPKKYFVSNTSVRAVSTEGFSSAELDIAILDRQDSIVLMQRENAYQAYPVESTYGVIQVKSKLTKKELRKAFENVASYKRLKKFGVHSTSRERGFGIVFAYDSELDWLELAKESQALAAEMPQACLPNVIAVLTKGHFLFADSADPKFRNVDIEAIQTLDIYGHYDVHNLCLFNIYTMLISLLSDSEITPVPLHRYFSLPLTSGQYSYEFADGFLAELGRCDEHGDFLRKISEDALKKVLDYCRSIIPTGFLEAMSEATGQTFLQPGHHSQRVWIYNPEGLTLSSILVQPSGQTAFDRIRCADVEIWIPFYYSKKETIVSGCNACASRERRSKPSRKRRSRRSPEQENTGASESQADS